MTADTTVLRKSTSLLEYNAFFAMQFALSSYPDDPVRARLRQITNNIQQTTDQDVVARNVRELSQLLSANLSLIEYCVWDYSLVSTVANSEFKSWVDGLRTARNESELDDEVVFQFDTTTYCVVSVALHSQHVSLRSWLKFFPEHIKKEDYFQRKTISTILDRFASNDTTIVAQSSDVLCALLPIHDDHFYSAEQIQNDKEWNYATDVLVTLRCFSK